MKTTRLVQISPEFWQTQPRRTPRRLPPVISNLFCLQSQQYGRPSDRGAVSFSEPSGYGQIRAHQQPAAVLHPPTGLQVWDSVCLTSLQEFCLGLEQTDVKVSVSSQVPAVPADSPPPQQPAGPPLWSCLLLPPLPGGGVSALKPSPVRLRLLLGAPPWQPVPSQGPGVSRHPLLLSPSAGWPRAAGGGGSWMGRDPC